MGLGEEPQQLLCCYHEVLAKRWDVRAVALTAAAAPAGSPAAAAVRFVVGIDDTIERRWGARMKARGIDRDPVRSEGALRQTSGPRWLS